MTNRELMVAALCALAMIVLSLSAVQIVRDVNRPCVCECEINDFKVDVECVPTWEIQADHVRVGP